jgi:hypothetical protein
MFPIIIRGRLLMPMPTDTLDDLYSAIIQRLAEPPYPDHYDSESEFESEVWSRITALVGDDFEKRCLTSHKERHGRSAVEWENFCLETPGPDVNVLGSNNRLDIVIKHPTGGSIGIEVKCLGGAGHTGKLTQGLGQALLGLANRDRTLLVIHCGTVRADERRHLQGIADKICAGTKTGILVVP